MNQSCFFSLFFVFTGQGTEELYDHKSDPMEWNNLINNPEYEAIKDKERLTALVPTQREPESPKN